MCCPHWLSRASLSFWWPNIVTHLELTASLIRWTRRPTPLSLNPSDHTSRWKVLRFIFTPLEQQVLEWLHFVPQQHLGNISSAFLIFAVCDLLHFRSPQGSCSQPEPPLNCSGCFSIKRCHGQWCHLPQPAFVPHSWFYYRLHWLHWDRWDYWVVAKTAVTKDFVRSVWDSLQTDEYFPDLTMSC